tara:strand:+ start:173 stop:3445 length:3273 start_codon:yes stop_codon:yes gene_type:complete
VKNTQIYPVIKIGGDYFSTNNTTFEGNYCKPILLNIPSIKQSVDIESRKFKISNVSLDLSNFPVSGERFSDRLSTSSLINTEVVVYFVHHNTSQEVYKGQIRRISHDDEKVKIELEDLTEQKAHKPLPKSTAPPSNYLPDKYANKPIPMVYGHVDRSPLLPYYSYSEDIGDDSGEVESILEYRLKIDTEQYSEIVEEIVNIGNTPFMKSGLFIKEADSYLNLHKTNAQLGTFAGVENFRYEGTSIVLDTDDVSYSEDESETSSNDFSKGRLRVHQIRRFNKVSWEETGLDYGGLIQGELQATSAGIGRITGTIDTDTYQSGFWGGEADDSATRDWNAGHFKCILEPISVPNSMAKDEDGNIEPPITRVLVDVEHFNFRNESNTPSGQTQNTEGSHPNVSSKLYTKWGVWVGGVPFDTTTSINQSEPNYYTNTNSINNITGFGSIDEILLDGFTTLTSYDNIKIGIPKHNYFVSGSGLSTTFDDDDDVVFNVDTTINNAFVVQTFFLDGITDKDYFVNVKGRVNTFNDHPFLLTSSDLSDDFDELHQWVIDNESKIVENSTQGDYDSIVELINGAINTNSQDAYVETIQTIILGILPYFIENPIDIIYDILRNEIGLTADQINEDDYKEARDAHDGWKFAFTVNKKTDSKKLIEEIAKSTKCLPHFKNDGTFGFNTIKDRYSSEDIDNATPIKEQEVINYSFKKTKPEDIVSEVGVKYKKDYAQDSYLKDVFSYFETAYAYNKYDSFNNHPDRWAYYGIENPEDALLEVESDYIRDDVTASNLRQFLFEHYKNDHLIFNIKLPISYNQLEVGDLVKFDKLFNGLAAYGIDYTKTRTLNTQIRYPVFMVTSTTKNLDSISIECMQLHRLNTLGREYGIAIEGNNLRVVGHMIRAGNFYEILVPNGIDYTNIIANSSLSTLIVQDVSHITEPENHIIQISENPPEGEKKVFEVTNYGYGEVEGFEGTFIVLRPKKEHDINGDGVYDVLINDYDVDYYVDSYGSGYDFDHYDLFTLSFKSFYPDYIAEPDTSVLPTGDVNYDGELNLLDIVQTSNYIMGNIEFNDDQRFQANLNFDAGVGVLDIVLMVIAILGE